MIELNIAELTSLSCVRLFSIHSSITTINRFSIIGEPEAISDSVLYIGNYSNDLQWYNYSFDRSVLIPWLSRKYSNWIFVIDNLSLLSTEKNNYIYVESVDKFVSELIALVVRNAKIATIAVTGSVGKTTFCRLLAELLPDSQLISSKRLTPLIIGDFFLNRIKPETKIVIAEVGFYYIGQVNELSIILNPLIGILLNVYDMHLDWNGVKDRKGILDEKLAVIHNSKVAIIPRHTMSWIKEIYPETSEVHQVPQESIKQVLEKISWIPRTLVGSDIVESLLLVKKVINYDNEQVQGKLIERIENASRLGRLKLVRSKQPQIFLDSHSSIAGYFQAISNNQYSKCCLVILSLHFGNESVEQNLRRIMATFNCFTQVLIERKLKSIFLPYSYESIQWIDKKGLAKIEEFEGIIFLHDPQGHRFTREYKKTWSLLITAST